MGIHEQAAKIDVIAGLERALDRTFDRLRENAFRQWQRHFPNGEPSDACVTIHVSEPPDGGLLPVPCAGILAPPSSRQRAKLRPRLA